MRLATALLAVFLLAGCNKDDHLETVRVIDGDTVAIESGPRSGERVRIVGINAPESRSRCETEAERAREEAAARRSKDYLTHLVRRGVVVQVEKTRADADRRDRYGRLLATLKTRDGADVSAMMVREGLAVPYDGRGRAPSWCGR